MRNERRRNHLNLLLDPRGAMALCGRLPNGGESNGEFARAVRAAVRQEDSIRIDGEVIDADDIEHAAAVLVAAHDGAASTRGLAATAEMSKRTAEAAMRFLAERSIIADMGNDNWVIPGEWAPSED